MPSKPDDFVTVRIPKDDWNRASGVAGEIGDVSGAWFVQRAVREILEMIDAPKNKAPRYIPRVVKIVDGVRLPDVELEDPAKQKESAPSRGGRGALRVGQG